MAQIYTAAALLVRYTYEITTAQSNYAQISLKPDLYLLIKYGLIYILKSDQFRPIAILSPLYKWIELRFLKYLQTYLDSQEPRQKPNQICTQLWYIPQHCAATRGKWENTKKKEGMCCLFVDHTNQPTTQSTEIFFYEILKEKEMHIIRRWSRFPTTLLPQESLLQGRQQ